MQTARLAYTFFKCAWVEWDLQKEITMSRARQWELSLQWIISTVSLRTFGRTWREHRCWCCGQTRSWWNQEDRPWLSWMDNVSCEQNHTITINSNLKGYNPNCFTTINNPQICFVGPILIQIIGLHIFCSVALSFLSIYFITLVTIYFANSDCWCRLRERMVNQRKSTFLKCIYFINIKTQLPPIPIILKKAEYWALSSTYP